MGVLVAGLLAGCSGGTTTTSRTGALPTASTATTLPSTTTPVVGTSFVETASDLAGLEFTFKAPKGKTPTSAGLSKAGEEMATTVVNNHVPDGRVWLGQEGIAIIDLPHPQGFKYGAVSQSLSSEGSSHLEDLEDTWRFTEDVFSRGGAPLVSGAGVQVLLGAIDIPTNGELNSMGVRLVGALAGLGISFVIVQTVVLDPGIAVWRIVALGQTTQADFQAVPQAVVNVFGKSIEPSHRAASTVSLAIPQSGQAA